LLIKLFSGRRKELLRRIVSGIMLTLLVIGIVALAINIKPVKGWTGTVYIRADGSIEPSDAPVITFDNVTYTLTDNITSSADGIVVERDNIMVDGADYTVQGAGTERGIDLGYRINVTIKNVKIAKFQYGIYIRGSGPPPSMHANNTIANSIVSGNYIGIFILYSHTNTLTGNIVFSNDYDGIRIDTSNHSILSCNNASNNGGTGIKLNFANSTILTDSVASSNNDGGIDLGWCKDCVVSSNNISMNGMHGIDLGWGSNNFVTHSITSLNNYAGLHLWYTGNNTLTENIASNNNYGIFLRDSGNNTIFHNNFANNTFQAYTENALTTGYSNIWENGYPSGGNYWSDYTGADMYSGPYQNETSSDGIGDTPYIIDANNTDNYPLGHPYGSIQNLNTGLIYLTIQSAINAPETLDGHTIFVRSGIYYENVVINKKVSLIGENNILRTIINGYYTYRGSVVSIAVDDARISGFTIQNGWCGIAVYSSDGCIITENRIMNNTYRGGGPEIYESGRGIWLIDSENCIVAKNTMESNDRNISFKGANNNTIINNTITNSLISWGIILENSHNNSISNNVVKYSVYDGIYLAEADNNEIVANFIMGNGDEGIYISGSNNTAIRNIVQNNSGEGIWLDWSDNNTVIGNTVINNKKRGILVWHSTHTMVYYNNFINNSWGQAYSNLINTWDDGYPSGGNYWSDYNSTDVYSGPYQNKTGSDGIGDTPYVIDENNQDNYPLMKPYPWASHDIGITSVATSKTIVGQGYNMFINVMAFNYGNYTENLNITIYANSTIVGEIGNVNLTSRNFAIVTFTWNTTGFAKGNYTISTYVESVLGESEIADNNFTDGWVFVAMIGDLTGGSANPWDFVPDDYCDGSDLSIVARCFGSYPDVWPPLVWHPNCDINNDGVIDGSDQIIISRHYGEQDP